MKGTFRSILALTCIFAASMQSLAGEATNALAVSVDKVFAILGDPEMKGDEKTPERHSKIRAVLGEGFDYEEILPVRFSALIAPSIRPRPST